MNEEPHHLTPVGDEALEARIIAWVLGEASPFEAAELENICEEKPEWRVFQRRMLAIHELLGEATTVNAAEDWKMPSEKRGKLDALIGAVEVIPEKPKRKPVVWWKQTAGLAAVLAIVAMIGSLVTGKVGKKSNDIVAYHETDSIVTYSAKMENRSPESAQGIFPVTPATPAEFEKASDAASVQVIRESQYPTEYEPPELPGNGRANASDNPFAAETGKAVLADQPADPFADGSQLEGAALRYRGAPAKEEATRVAEDDRVPMLDEIPLVGSLFQEKLSAPAAPAAAAAAATAQVIPTAEIEVIPQAMTYAKNLEGAGGGGFMPQKETLERSLSKSSAGPVSGEGKDRDSSNYNRAAYGQTRAELLPEVDEAWKGAIPADKGVKVDSLANDLTPPAVFAGNTTTLEKTKGRELNDEHQAALKEIQEIDALVSKPNITNFAAKIAPLTLPEIFASQEPYSTFSLRVSDNAFRIAQAAMAQNQRPAAESVRVEEFYNAFDYGDPVPTAQEPVAASMEQAAHPILPQRNLLRIGLRTAAAGRGAGQPLHLTLLVDQSGSMSRGDRSDALLASVKELSTLLNAQDHVSVIGFSRTPRLLAEKVPGDQHARLIELLARTPSDGGTNLEEALKLGEVVAKRNHLAGAQNRLLLLTDGAANLGNADPDRLAAWVKTLRQQNIAFDIAGIGTDGLNDPLLVEIARNGNGRYYVMNDATQAKQQFAAQLAGAFRPAAENVKVQVQFNPQRVGKYQLIGFEKDRLRTEDFRNDKVDAAEMAAAEAGQALYQIELLPEGTGDVGEVSVRFRDVATQQMVERKWTIRYDPITPAFDRATPTMQLAGLAMLSAQKLQGGAAAPMIRFSEMQEPLRNVREEFSSNKRVGELLEMIQKLND